MIIKLVFNIRTKKTIKMVKKSSIHLVKRIKSILICLYVAVVVLVGVNIEDTHSFFTDTISGLNNTFTTSDSLPPLTPTQEFPDDLAVLNSSDLYFDWTDVTYWHGSLAAIYDFQLSLNSDMSNPFFENTSTTYSRYPETGTMPTLRDGTYYWHVRACKQIPQETQCSLYSSIREVTVDDIAPIIEITRPVIGVPISLDSTIPIHVSLAEQHPLSWSLYCEDTEAPGGAPCPNFNNITGTTESYSDTYIHDWDTNGVAEGSYFIKFEAIDQAGNHAPAVNPTSIRKIKIDRTFFGEITVTNSPEKEVNNRILNNSFEQYLDEWKSKGNVKAIKKDDNNVEPHDRARMVRIGTDILETTEKKDQELESSITQVIDNSGYGIRSISFWVNYFPNQINTQEAGFKVYVNDKLRHQIWDNDVTEISTGWQFVSLYVVDDSSKELELKFETSMDTVVYIDKISTDIVFVNSSAIFRIRENKAGNIKSVHYRYYIDEKEYYETGKLGTKLQLVGQPDDYKFEYWSVNKEGIEEAHRFLEVYYDEKAPDAIEDLTIQESEDNSFKLQFTSPEDDLMNSASGYDIRYSLYPITEDTKWENLYRVHMYNSDDSPGILSAPRASGKQEEFTIDQLASNTIYYFAVISKDATKNWSDVSNIAIYDPDETNQDDDDEEPTPILSNHPISFNELSYYGKDEQLLPGREWIEFYNSSDEAISMEGWSIQTEDDTEVIIKKDYSDNDLNYDNDGEIELEAKGYLVLFTDKLNLRQLSHTSLFLYDDEGRLVDSIFYQGDFEDYTSQAKYAEEEIIFWHYESVPTPGSKNARKTEDLVPIVKLFWQEPYNAKIAVINSDLYDLMHYELQYDHLAVDGSDKLVTELITDKFKLDTSRTEETNIYLSTCSSDGFCIPHGNIEADSFSLKAILSNDFGDERELIIGLTGDWEE